MNPPQITLKLLVFFHFVLTVWASQNGFLGLSYVYMNLFVLSLGVWSIVHHESAEPVFMFLICHVFSILQDIILLGINEPRGYNAYEQGGRIDQTTRNEYRFSLGMSIVNLIIKPVTAFLVYRIYRERGGSYGDFTIPGVGNLPSFNIGGSPSHGPYENIDTPPTAPAPTDEEQAYNQPYNSQEKH
ncbi:type-1 angiotensin II receptor-associated protein-like [Mya arenaria]|uniref:type-1 angiotensin II receptor-associated protein-like n=1 Tax=Mya arenaria TaxID=6604 RepID=UPI0022E7416D|nr:type-1 angiotensin II receptor-associated protein-like [Mya arenaria]